MLIMKIVYSIPLLLVLAVMNDLYPDSKITHIAPLPASVEKYEPVYIDFQIIAQFLNPFDVNDICADVLVTDSQHEMFTIPAFYYQQTAETSSWQSRFTPARVGTYYFQIRIKSMESTILSKTISLNVIPSNRKGFIRLDPQSFYRFQYDDGSAFRGLGENVCWTQDYVYYFQKLKEHGCNFSRIWMCPWNLYLEWNDPGLGRYHLGNAARLDSVLMLAEQYGIHLMLCLDYHGAIQREDGYFKEKKWLDNPYNSQNGGPCATPGEFFTNPQARTFYQNRLRYLVARYAYHPNLLAWEFWNEVDLTAGHPDEVIAWHAEMADYLKRMDPFHHLISTSFSGLGYPEIWKIGDLDFSQTHHYGNPDLPVLLPLMITRHEKQFDKPHVIGEYGVDFRGADESRQNDPEHIGFHHGLWAGLFSPTPILPMTWWWDTLIDADNLYSHFKVLHNFAGESFVDPSGIHSLNSDSMLIRCPSTGQDLVLLPMKGWGKNSGDVLIIRNDGFIENESDLPSFLYGTQKADMGGTVRFQLDYQADGEFGVHVQNVSDIGLLQIFLDDRLILTKPLPLGPGAGEWEKSEWNDEWLIYQGIYNRQYRIPVPRGKHIIRVENAGSDWIEIGRYLFRNCGIERPMLDVRGFSQGEKIYLWIRHRDFSWKMVKMNGLPHPIENASIQLNHDLDGTYRIEWWDTFSGDVIRCETIHLAKSEAAEFMIPVLQKELACKIFISEPSE